MFLSISPFMYLSALTDAEAETPILWPPHAKSWLIGQDSDAGRDWGQEEKGTTEDEMAGWHHWLNGREFEWTPGVGDGQGGLECCDSWGCKESNTTERLNWIELKVILNSQPSQNTAFDIALHTRGIRPSSTHQRAGTSPSYTGPWINFTHQGAEARSKRNYDPAACGEERPKT